MTGTTGNSELQVTHVKLIQVIHTVPVPILLSRRHYSETLRPHVRTYKANEKE
jgi:hypothetical protein